MTCWGDTFRIGNAFEYSNVLSINQKADKIEQAMARVPFDKRGKIFEYEDTACMDVQYVLAKKRYRFFTRAHANTIGSVDNSDLNVPRLVRGT